MQFPEEQVANAVAYAYHPKAIIIKTRMHALIFAIKNNIPPPDECDPVMHCAITYNKKLKDIGYEKYTKLTLRLYKKAIFKS